MGTVGFIGGKFLPLHQGHVYAITQAACRCDELYVVLSHSPVRDQKLCEAAGMKPIPYEVRLRWLSTLVKDMENVRVIAVEDGAESDETYDWQAGAADIKRKIGKPIDFVFSSEQSYDPIFRRLARKGKEGWEKQFSVLDYYNAQFGLGVKTGIDLPGEKTGWENPNLYYGNLADAMIGQYDLFTPIQIGQYVSTIANGGYRVRPHLVKEIRKGTTDPKQKGQTLAQIEPQVLNRVNIDPKYIQVVKEGMRMVTQPGGTVQRFNGLPFAVAAKSGTAQTGKSAENALVVGFAPYEKPQLVFVVVAPNSLRDGTSSSDATGPIARRLLEAYNELNPGVLTNGVPIPNPPSSK